MHRINQSIELVTHCFAAALPVYAEHLRFQLASLIQHPPKVHVTYVLFWAGREHDPAVAKVIDRTLDLLFKYQASTHKISCRWIVQEKGKLFRRAIGRHQRSQETTCDVLYFADADYYWGEGCLDAICETVKDDGRLYFPRHSQINVDHQAGERMLTANRDAEIPSIVGGNFKSQKNQFAIGGIQVLGRETAKRVGYLGDKPKWQRPIDEAKGMSCFRDDCAWRRLEFPHNKKVQNQVPMKIPNLYRIRHAVSSLRPNGFQK